MASSFRRLGDEEKGIGAAGREVDGEISASNDAFDAPLNQRPAELLRKGRVSPTFSVAFPSSSRRWISAGFLECFRARAFPQFVKEQSLITYGGFELVVLLDVEL
ncbi:hypothetical protein MA16_Dca022658 [Dendrobium catenatum]|uniref:Uncharacterized protein n=1 Tax=Dendrobium catenatum TaxID=906689 RepID=A0A2I0VRT5_9ASPA|nr:hypothetical protein MA16_Dca022658 [Dendrobium catenatum]